MKKNVVFFLLVFFVFLSFVRSQDWVQVGQALNGEAPEDRAGTAIALSADGSIVAIGAPYNDSAGTDAGQVRVYQNNAGTWTQLGAAIAGEEAYDYFGGSVSLSADGLVVAIGAIGNDGNGSYAGHVRVFQYNSGNWIQLGQDIEGEDEGDRCGYSVSLNADGSILAIGAVYNDGNAYQAGQVRVFQYDSGVWTQLGQDIDGESAMEEFGYSVSLSSDGYTLAIGTPYNSSNGDDAGYVRIFQYNANSWIQAGANIVGEGIDDFAGCSVSLNADGSIVAVGAHGTDSASGHVRVYQNVNDSWIQIGTGIEGEPGAHFGNAVSLSADGSIVAAGADISSANGYHAGQISIYQNNEGSWTLTGSPINGEAEEDIFGISIGISADGSVVAAGASNNDTNGNNAGQVRVYQYPQLPEITTQPENQINICPGSNVSFSVSGNYVDTYQWQEDEGNGFVDLTDAGVYSGTTTGTLTITGVTLAMNNYQYRCVLTSAVGFITSDAALLATDDEAPVADNAVLEDVVAQCEVLTLDVPTATDNCAGAISGISDVTLPLTTQGTTLVTWTYDDGNGNISTQTQNIIIDDNTPPSISCPGNQSLDLNQGETSYVIQGTEFDPLSTDDNCNVASITNNINGQASLAGVELPVGMTTIEWTVTDEAGNETACSFDVMVNEYNGIRELNESGISIYPNPSAGIFTIANAGKYAIRISDIAGKTVYQSDEHNSNIQIRMQTSGVYFIRFTSEKRTFFAKILIE